MRGGKDRQRLQLRAAIEDTFNRLVNDPNWDLPAKLVASMPRRINAVKHNLGWPTKY